MQNPHLIGLGNRSPQEIVYTLVSEAIAIFREFNLADYQNLLYIFYQLGNDHNLNDQQADALREFIDYGISAIARRYELGEAIHPGTMNVLMRAIQVFNKAYGHLPGFGRYRFSVEFLDITQPTEDFMVEVVRPMTQNPRLLTLDHPVFVAQADRAREAARAPGAETRIARTLAEFRAMGGDAEECPVCMEEFIERPAKGRPPVFMPVVFHKDEKGKWFHPMHTLCTYRLQKDECPLCRVKVIWPKMTLSRKTRRRPNSDSTSRRSARRSPRNSFRRSSSRQSPRRSVKRRSADF
jgi:hypothetical protein